MIDTADVTTVFRPRVGRLVAGIRAVFAWFSLLAIWLDPRQPTVYPTFVYWALGLYAAYASVLALSRLRLRRSPSRRSDDVTLVIDISILSALVFLTDGPTSPFFVWFNLILVSAMLTRSWRSVVAVSLLLTGVYVFGSLVFLALGRTDQGFELHRFLIRAGYLAASGLLLAYFSREQERLNREVARILGWADTMPGPAAVSPLEQSLSHASAVMRAEAVVLAWEPEEEPHGSIARLDATGYRRERLSDPLGDMAQGDDFALPGPASGDARWLPPGLPDAPVAAFAIAGEEGSARLFVARHRPFDEESMMLGRLVAAQVAVGLARTAALDTLSEAVAVEDRVRLARDLHDGILQSLAGTALHLQNLLAETPQLAPEARQRIERLQTLLRDEQRQLRSFIDRLRPWRAREAGRIAIGGELAALSARLENQWDVAVTLALTDLPPLPATLATEMQFILREGVANAVRHGRAARVEIGIAATQGHLDVRIADHGHGLPVHGSFDAATVRAGRIGSRSLLDRITRLGGEMSVASDPGGLRLHIRLPIEE